MTSEINKLIECCESFINALCDVLNDVVDKLATILSEANLNDLVTQYVKAIKAESDSESKKIQEQISRKIFDMQIKHYKYDSKIKSVRFNRRIAPKSWTGRNFKKGGWYGKNK